MVRSVSPLAGAEDGAGVAVPLPLPLAVGRQGLLGYGSLPGLVALEEVPPTPQKLLVNPAVAFDVREDLIHPCLTANRRARGGTCRKRHQKERDVMDMAVFRCACLKCLSILWTIPGVLRRLMKAFLGVCSSSKSNSVGVRLLQRKERE